jgi:hypothetical protein
MNVLLVEPAYKTKYVPLPLMKFSSYHKSKDDNVKYIKGFNWFIDFEPDLIYITSLYSWHYDLVIDTIKQYIKRFPNAEVYFGGAMATMFPDEISEIFIGAKFKLKTGLCHKDLDDAIPDYTMFPNIDYSISYTTRSCTRRCPWCIVHKLEHEFMEIPDWYKKINMDKPRILFYDNNFLASSKEHILNTLLKCAELGKEIDFNQALDARLFKEWHAKAFSYTKIRPLRFAFDSMETDGHIQKAITLAKNYGIKDISVLMLYNFTETLEELYYRMSEMVKLNVDTYLMRFQPLNTKEFNVYIGKHWNDKTINNLKMILNSCFLNRNIGRIQEGKEHLFWKVFGKTAEEFVDILNTYDKEQHRGVKND